MEAASTCTYYQPCTRDAFILANRASPSTGPHSINKHQLKLPFVKIMEFAHQVIKNGTSGFESIGSQVLLYSGGKCSLSSFEHKYIYFVQYYTYSTFSQHLTVS